MLEQRRDADKDVPVKVKCIQTSVNGTTVFCPDWRPLMKAAFNLDACVVGGVRWQLCWTIMLLPGYIVLVASRVLERHPFPVLYYSILCRNTASIIIRPRCYMFTLIGLT